MNNFVAKIFQFGIIVLITVLIVTNPGTGRYESYASQQLISYFKDDLCSQRLLRRKTTEPALTVGEIQSTCRILIDTTRPQIQMVLIKNTRQQNFLLFSLYHTNLNLSPIVPEYNFATLGIVDRFFTYQSEPSE